MRCKRILSGVLLSGLLVVCLGLWREPGEVVTYRGMSDASAGVAIDDTTFLAADDERNVIGVFDAQRPGKAIAMLDWNANLGIAPEDEHAEADIEGCAALGRTVYWITSHGRNKDGKWRANRHRFFAMTVEKSGQQVTAQPVGKPYKRLAIDLAADPRLKELGVAESLGAGRKKDESLAPKRAGLNIEGLSAAADGRSLFIGLRNPRPDGMALIVPLLNPEAVLKDRASPQLGEPVRLRLARDLGDGRPTSLGIRSMEYSPRHKAYLIVAGPHDERRVLAMYRWSGGSAQPELLPGATKAIADLKDFCPEGLIVYPNYDEVQLLSDDGSLPVRVGSSEECSKGTFQNGFCEAKSLLDPDKRTFRSMWVRVE